MIETCPLQFCAVSGLHRHGTDALYQGRRRNNPYVTGPPLADLAHNCNEREPEMTAEPVVERDHRGFVYTFWDEIPWKEGCAICGKIKADPHREVGPVIDHWAAVGIPLEPTKQREGDQRLPDAVEDGPDDFVLYIADIEARRQVGIERYGQAHRPFNGRNTLLDAYEEVLDTGLYLRSLLRQAEADREKLIEVVAQALQPKFEASRLYQNPQEQARRDAVEFATVAVDRVMGWVSGQREAQS